MVWEKNGGPKKKFFEKKNFFAATFLHLSQHNIVDTRDLRRQPKFGGPSSYRFRVMGGQKFSPKKFKPPYRKIWLTDFDEIFRNDCISSVLSGAEAGKIFYSADCEKLAPKICDMNPHYIFHILGISSFSK
jgi:hypothetical protein